MSEIPMLDANLMALNVAIAAARASNNRLGSAGVATILRSLADESTRTTRELSAEQPQLRVVAG